MVKNIQAWLGSYFLDRVNKKLKKVGLQRPVHIFLCICDHFEPLWNGADEGTGLKRVREWCKQYPAIADKYRDSDGSIPKYTFFYPAEEYRPAYLDQLAELCRKGYAEVEVHLHHDNDTADNLRRTLIDYKKMLAEKHGLLSRDKATGEIKYGFIHGNWALDNSRPDGHWCGVNNELTILQETGCYADFTLPSAPDVTQTAKINSIYYAVGKPGKSKAHNSGIDAWAGRKNQPGLLLVQGPLTLNWHDRKAGIFPRIENGLVDQSQPADLRRVKLWVDTGVRLQGAPGYIFIKLHTHGCQEKNAGHLLNGGLDRLFSLFLQHYNDGQNYVTHFVSARELVNVVYALEDGFSGAAGEMRNYRLTTNGAEAR
jgi:hypothetical protein